MKKSTFEKPSLTPENLLTKYCSQGLMVAPNEQEIALKYFTFVGAYRLKGYLHHFIDPTTKRLPSSFTLEHLIQQYEFDRELRALTIDAIDRIEVAVRTVMANHLSLKHSPHWFLQQDIFDFGSTWTYEHLLSKIQQDVKQAQDKRFIKHYQNNYHIPELPPSWAVSECLSFGFWSKTYSVLRHSQDKKAISMKFGIDNTEVFASWIRTLTVIRNIAAHHGQLLRIKINVRPMNYNKKGFVFDKPQSFASAAKIIQYLLEQIGLTQNWNHRLAELFVKYPLVGRQDLGFTEQ